MNRCVVGLAILLAGLAREISAADSQEILASAAAKISAYKSWQADYVQQMDMLGGKMNLSGHLIARMPNEVRMELTMPIMGQTGQVTVVMGKDNILWEDTIIAGKRHVIKMDMAQIDAAGVSVPGADSAGRMNPVAQLDQMRNNFDFRGLPRAELHGQPMHVLEGTWKSNVLASTQVQLVEQLFERMRVYIGQEDGFIHKTEMFAKDSDEVAMAQEFMNIKFNQTYEDTAFKYTPPADIEVMDATELARKSMQARPAAKPAPAPSPQGGE